MLISCGVGSTLSHSQILSSANNLCKQFGSGSGRKNVGPDLDSNPFGSWRFITENVNAFYISKFAYSWLANQVKKTQVITTDKFQEFSLGQPSIEPVYIPSKNLKMLFLTLYFVAF